MSKYVFLFLLGLILSGCGCRCRYNDYLPENNPLIIPEDLKSEQK